MGEMSRKNRGFSLTMDLSMLACVCVLGSGGCFCCPRLWGCCLFFSVVVIMVKIWEGKCLIQTPSDS